MRLRPCASRRLETTRAMAADGRRPPLQASMSAWRFVPLPEIRTVIFVGDECRSPVML